MDGFIYRDTPSDDLIIISIIIIILIIVIGITIITIIIIIIIINTILLATSPNICNASPQHGKRSGPLRQELAHHSGPGACAFSSLRMHSTGGRPLGKLGQKQFVKDSSLYSFLFVE